MPKAETKSDTADTIEEKLDVLIRLAALQLARNEETLEARAMLLSRAGLRPTEIAKLCDTTLGSVSVRLAEARRRKAGAKRRSK